MKRRKRAIARAARARLSLIAATSGDERELAKQELLKEMKTLDALLNDPRVCTNTVLVEAHSQHKKVQELAPSYIDLIERQPLVLADIKLAEDEATERSNVATTTLKAVSHGSAVTQRLAGKMDDLHQHSDSITEILQLIEIASKPTYLH
jgi:methyl-accepting chemotaxis protein